MSKADQRECFCALYKCLIPLNLNAVVKSYSIIYILGNADRIKAEKVKVFLKFFSLYYEVILIFLLMDELFNQYWFECHASIFQVKSRMMGDSAYKNTVDCFIKTLKYEVCYINFYIFSFSAFLSPEKKKRKKGF